MKIELYWKSIEAVLKQYPNLRKRIPSHWPQSITYEQVQQYEINRTNKFWEHINLSTLAYTLNNTKEKDVCDLYKSILNSLEWFATEMYIVQRAKKVLAPLWENQWNVFDNPFWSVISEVKLTQLLKKNKWIIIGFDKKIGETDKTANICASREEDIHYIDVEAASMTKIVQGDDESFRKFICGRANQKIKDKFANVSDNEYAIAAIIFRPQTDNLSRFIHNTFTTNIVKQNIKMYLVKFIGLSQLI